MNPSLNKFGLALTLLAVLTLSLMSLPNVHSQEITQSASASGNVTGTLPGPSATLPDSAMSRNAVSFMSNVAELDLAKYTVQVEAINISATSGVPNEEALKYSFTATGSNLDVILIFRNDILVWCKLYPISGSPLYTQSQTDPLSAAHNLLENYRNFSQASYIPTFTSMLNSASRLQNTTDAAANIVQQISTSGNTESMQWTYTVNSITDNYKVVSMTFQNGGLTFFQDNWNFFTVGNANVNVPQNEAIQIAKQYATQSYSYLTGDNQTVSNFTFCDEPAIASLSMEDRGNGILYPQWNMYLPLNSTYPDGVTAIHVLEWADTGQISIIAAVGSGAAPPSQPSGQDTTVVQTSSSKAASPNYSSDYEAMAVATLIAATMIASYLIYKRKR
ncbi:MAG: hypothetical protein ABR909_07065 [Candidatus Bathyarchaeia archaeon]|jgi:hypothetical protein